MNHYFEGVCETHVILTPGARRREGPSIDKFWFPVSSSSAKFRVPSSKLQVPSRKLWAHPYVLYFSGIPHVPQDGQRGPKDGQRETKGVPKGATASQMNKTEFRKKYSLTNAQWWCSRRELNHVYTNLKSGKSAPIICLVAFCKQNHFAHRKPHMIPWSLRSAWYHDFGPHTRNCLYQKTMIRQIHVAFQCCWHLNKVSANCSTRPVGVFCTLLEPPKCHMTQHKIAFSRCSWFNDLR